jgi:curved DNA-binding protein CbpA
MSDALDNYRVLGVPVGATSEEIKRAYRRLVRTYHPDVSVDKLTAQEKFIRIVAAYQTLSDPLERALYDQKLLEERRRQEADRRKQFEESLRKQTAESALTTAEIHYLRGQTDAAIEQVRRVLKADPHCAEAFALLGDVYLVLRQFDDATMVYSYAVQYAPENEVYQQKLERAVAREAAEPAAEKETDEDAALGLERVGLFGVCAAVVAAVAFAAVIAYLRVSEPTLVLDYVPKAPLLLGPVVGFFVGAAMVLLLWLRPFDDDFYAATLTGASSFGGVPVGVYLGVLGLLWFYAAAFVYLVVCLVEEQVSWSMAKAFGATFLIVLAVALADRPHQVPILLLAGNGTFVAFLFGWGLGSMGRRPW